MNNERICPVSKAGRLDMKLRKWLQNPYKILKPYTKEGMVVVDYGCGPGFFTTILAELVGDSGCVLAVDIQQGMLDILNKKIINTELNERICLHKCEKDILGLTEPVDFIFAFYVIHEVDNQDSLFRDFNSILVPGGRMLLAEPNFHVSISDYQKTLAVAKKNGFEIIDTPWVMFSRAALLAKM